MKKVLLAALIIGFGMTGYSQKEEETPQPDSLQQKANYNTTRSNKKALKDPESKKAKEEKTSGNGGGGDGTQAVLWNYRQYAERKEMR